MSDWEIQGNKDGSNDLQLEIVWSPREDDRSEEKEDEEEENGDE